MNQQRDGHEEELPERSPRDMRAFASQGERRLLVGAVLLLIVVGGGLIALLLGPGEALGAAPCLLAGVAALVGLYLLLTVLDRWVNR